MGIEDGMMELKSFAICFHQHKGSPKRWVRMTAPTARAAVGKLKREFIVYEILGVYKEQQEWKWK